MKRAILLIFFISTCVVGLLSIRGTLPFVPVPDANMISVLRFFQSQPGIITTIIALVLLAIFLYRSEVIRLSNLLLRAVLSPVINEEKHANFLLTRQIEVTEKKITATEEALEEFAAAISQYARHLSSHTSAIQGLSEASQELKKSAAVQNSFLLDLVKNTEESLVHRDELLTTMKINLAPPEKPAPPTVKHARWKVLPSYRALHQPAPATPTPEVEEPALEVKRTPFEAANLVEAMVLPYYRALSRLEKENLAPGAEKSTAQAKKAVEAIMFPFYRTLYQTGPENPLPAAAKPATAIEKPDENKPTPPHHETARPDSPWYSRRRHPLKPW